ncbi:MAG: hypothetical protein FWE07_01740 [Turicibacter sp.]|nr:hypothetical protein [Turicibacter sp.]
MGKRISAGLFLEFEVISRTITNFSDEFLDHYELVSEEGTLYQMKEAFFLANFKSFLQEFNDFFEIEEIGCHHEEERSLTWEDIPDFKTMDEFCAFWQIKKRNDNLPFTCEGNAFYCVTGLPKLTWLFYDGTYEAKLSDYHSLYHFEKAVQAVIKNPLGKLVRIGLYG